MDATPEGEIGNLVGRFTVFGRVLPKYKFKFLQGVKGKEITAMTGDGVNDIPALVEADVGLSMGSGTDAAKEASDIVLLDDNFKTIIDAIRLGRAVVANIGKMLFYVISTSMGEALTMVGALLLNMPLPVTAVQVLWINLVTDTFTVLPLGLGAPETHQMEHPPRDPRSSIIDSWSVAGSIILGLTMAAVTLFVFQKARPNGYLYAQTAAFVSLVVAQWANALNANFSVASWLKNLIRPNLLLFGGILLAAIAQIVAMYGPLAGFLNVVRLEAADILMAVVLPIAAVLIVGDLYKLARKTFLRG